MNAYSELYLDDAMSNLGGMLDYAVNDCGYDIETFFEWFSYSRIGASFEKGNPKYVTGMSGVELARELIWQLTGKRAEVVPRQELDCSKEYWTGWVLAYYQNQRNMHFSDMIDSGLTADYVISKYILHEADISKFVEMADTLIEVSDANKAKESVLRRFRTYYGLTQRQLSEKSGVTLRMIQLYEQGQNDLSKAQAKVVLALARALDCSVEELLDTKGSHP